MTEYMNEAKRLAQAYADAVLLGEGNDEALAALLAHIQRGVPEGWKLVPVRLPMETEMRPVIARLARAAESGQVILFDDFWSELLAAAPDHFRDAAEMVAEPADGRIAAAIHYPECWDTAAYPTVESALAEVFAHYHCTEHDAPAEAPDGWEYYYKDNDCPAADSGDPNCICWYDEGRGPYNNARHDDEDTFLEWRRVKAPAPAEVPMPEPDMSVWDTEEVRTYSDECIQQYGAACRAAGEAAGYARVLEWAVSRWKSEVENRPLENKDRRPLDDVWRQVVRFAGGDPDALLGPSLICWGLRTTPPCAGR